MMRKVKAARHDADHSRRHAIEPHRLTDDARLLCVPACPEAVAQHCDRSGARRFINCRKISPEDRVLAQYREGIGSEFGPVVRVWDAALVAEAQAQAAVANRRHARK